MNEPIGLRVSNLQKSFETERNCVEVLRGITFEMAKGQNLTVTGPSGSGKSTLLHLIGTLEAPSSGTVEILGKDPFRMAEAEVAHFRSRIIGFVFQDHHLLPQYSVLENVLIPTLALERRQGDAEERARNLLEKVGLSNRLDHRPAHLSGGERQRAAVARALINQPTLLLCDEPTGNLDQHTAESVSQLLFDLHREEQTILIVVTHSLQLAALFERRFELRDGQCFEV